MASDIDNILLELKKDILRVVDNKIDKEIKQVYTEETEHIYKEYSPRHPEYSRYRSGKDGSFADDVNFEAEIELNNNGITYTLHNERRTDCNCSYCRAKSNPYIDIFIEDGIYGNHRLEPRPAYERTQERISDEELVENILGSELKKNGWDV